HHVRLDRRVSPARRRDGRLRWGPATYLARRLSSDLHKRWPGLSGGGGPRPPHRPGVATGAGAVGGGHRSLRRLARRSLALVAALFATLAVPGGALAHPRLVASDPLDLCAEVPAPIADPRCVTGVVVAAPPLVIRLTFNEPVQPIGRGVRVVAPSGRRVERGPAHAGGRDVRVDVDAAEQGTYVVSWRVVSSDAQPEQGRFAFSVGRPTATPALLPGDGGPASGVGFAVAVVGRALHFLGYALGFGSLAFRWLVLPLGASRVAALDRALWRLTRFGVVALLLAEPLVVLGHVLRLGIAGDSDVLADVLESRVGLVAGQRLGIALTLWAMLTALETGSSITLKLALALGVA